MQDGTSSFNGAASNPLRLSREVVFSSLNLFPVLPDFDGHIAALVNNDVVHKAGTDSVENIRKYRLGGAGYNRACWAVRRDQETLQSAIYLHKDFTAVRTPRDLAGNVRDILSTETQKAPRSVPASVIFYSITRVPGGIPGAGEALIAKLHERLNGMYKGESTVFSTLSPLRPMNGEGIEKFIETADVPQWHTLDDAGKRAVAIKFLMRKEEPVQKFHMGNGAIIGDIKLDADTMGSGKYRLMVNYIYDRDPEALKANAARFRACQPGDDILELVSPYLLEEIKGFMAARKTVPVRSLLLSDIPATVHAPHIS